LATAVPQANLVIFDGGHNDWAPCRMNPCSFWAQEADMTYKQIFEEATAVLRRVNHLLEGDRFIRSCRDVLCADGYEFRLDRDVSIPYNGPGIYLFWADLLSSGYGSKGSREKNLFDFLTRWDRPAASVQYFPKANRSRAKRALQMYDSEEMIPFYLGKSERVAHRVRQHIEIDGSKSTYALKLRARSDLLRAVTMRVNCLPLPITKDSYYLMARVETLLREEFMPIIGK
jgi:hypothetical protein